MEQEYTTLSRETLKDIRDSLILIREYINSENSYEYQHQEAYRKVDELLTTVRNLKDEGIEPTEYNED